MYWVIEPSPKSIFTDDKVRSVSVVFPVTLNETIFPTFVPIGEEVSPLNVLPVQIIVAVGFTS